MRRRKPHLRFETQLSQFSEWDLKMFFAERIKQWLRPRGPPPQPREEAEGLNTKVEMGGEGTFRHGWPEFDLEILLNLI